MSAKLIRRYLIREPRPSKLRITTDEGIQEMQLPDVPKWADVAESVDALNSSLIEMLDDKGKLIRAFKAETYQGDDEEDAIIAQKNLAQDAETARFTLVARLLADAYKFSTEVAFDKLVGLLDGLSRINNDRMRESERLADKLRKAIEENANLNIDAAMKHDPLTDLVQAFMSAKAQGELERTLSQVTPPKPNGKGKPA